MSYFKKENGWFHSSDLNSPFYDDPEVTKIVEDLEFEKTVIDDDDDDDDYDELFYALHGDEILGISK